MDQTETSYTTDSSTPQDGSYWTSVLLVGGIFSLVAFVINIAFGYMQITSEPSGSFVTPMTMSGLVVCLATCIAGMVTVWHYTRDVTPHIKLGRGALVGFLTGGVIVLASAVLNELWLFIDPDYTEKILDSVVANVEMMDMPADAREQMIDSMAAGIRDTSILQQLAWGIPITGLLNLLTGMLGVKLFAAKEEETI